MTGTLRLDLDLPDPGATDRLGGAMARLLAPGDTVLLEGPLGAGKSHLARAIIRALLGADEEVPSPTFTLMQTYPFGDGEIVHADLYRIAHPRELDEIGLTDLLGEAICLIEWPDRLAGSAPGDALRVTLAPGETPETRRAVVKGPARFAGLRP